MKFYCLSNFMNLVFGIVCRARKWGFARSIMRRLAGIWGFGTVLWLSGMAQGLAQTATPPSPDAAITLPTVEVVATSPLPGGGENPDNIPALVQTVPAEDFARTNSPSVTDTLQQQVPGAVVDRRQRQPISRKICSIAASSPRRCRARRKASPSIRTAFASTRLLATPSIGISSPLKRSTALTYLPSNPAFGLNALGGAVSLQMKNGFLWQGLRTQIMGGSFGRVSGLFEYGKQIDDYSLYVTGDATRDDGWRFFSPSP